MQKSTYQPYIFEIMRLKTTKWWNF